MMIKASQLNTITQLYFQRYAFQKVVLTAPPQPDTRMILVIPSHAEPALLSTLVSLTQCAPTSCHTEVISVINHGQNADEQVVKLHEETLQLVQEWKKAHSLKHLSFQEIYAKDLPKKHAGVGLARKIGMDEALWRFNLLGYDGMIVCLDADCTVSKNYLRELEKVFVQQSKNDLGVIHFEHDLDSIQQENLKEGIIYYELFLRYYIQGLSYAQYPFDFHTIGSSMAARASLYGKQGGMNRKKAGEDFYFLHKLAPHGKAGKVNRACVFPSGRVSDRVPFGTGKAQGDWLNGASKIAQTYRFEIFEDLKQLLLSVERCYQLNASSWQQQLAHLPQSVHSFLQENTFEEALEEMNKHSKTLSGFRKKFFQWLDGFKVLKFVHHARDRYYPNLPVEDAARNLLLKKYPEAMDLNPVELLNVYRELDRAAH
ncbi:glycosyltransferase family A protein [Rapidithrix thailandica]|uniref:Glycosyltransferase family A protein n=1 Tax=Rapidithrix thailandica TaxID=413964 RepID=A0AAW9SE93_9BACT